MMYICVYIPKKVPYLHTTTHLLFSQPTMFASPNHHHHSRRRSRQQRRPSSQELLPRETAAPHTADAPGGSNNTPLPLFNEALSEQTLQLLEKEEITQALVDSIKDAKELAALLDGIPGLKAGPRFCITRYWQSTRAGSPSSDTATTLPQSPPVPDDTQLFSGSGYPAPGLMHVRCMRCMGGGVTVDGNPCPNPFCSSLVNLPLNNEIMPTSNPAIYPPAPMNGNPLFCGPLAPLAPLGPVGPIGTLGPLGAYIVGSEARRQIVAYVPGLF